VIENDQGLTLWLRSWGAGDRDWHGVDGENADDEEGENSFEEHDDMECCEVAEITTAPGLKFGRQERRAGVGCTAAEESRERNLNHFIDFWETVGVKFRPTTNGLAHRPTGDERHLGS